MSTEDHHFRREDRAHHWVRIAAHLESHPEDLATPLANIERWLAHGRVHSAPLQQWRGKIIDAQDSPEAMRELLAYLAAPNHDAEPLKSCSPFVGLPIADPARRSP